MEKGITGRNEKDRFHSLDKNRSQNFSVDGYYGKLLSGNFSDKLRQRVKECISAIRVMESLNGPVIPYLSAWKEDEKIIWYEYVGSGVLDLLKCPHEKAAEIFGKSVIDRRSYRYIDSDKQVEEEIVTRDKFSGHREGLRRQGKQSGIIDVVYKMTVPGGGIVWLKDQANIESFDQDNVCISIGFLTDVTKEMEQKDLFEKIGYFDELTKLPKRSIMDRIFEINIGSLKRKHIDDFIFMMIDIDYFKSVNDNFGHPAGDYVLSELADVMTATKRKEDEIGRYGGEEFYGFSNGSIEHGHKFAERLRKTVAEHRFIYHGQKIRVTVSIGLAAATQESSHQELSPDLLIKAPDRRLFVAKKSGKNQVVWKNA